MKNKKSENDVNYKNIILIVISVCAIFGTVLFIYLTLKDSKKDDEFKIEGIDITPNKDMLKDTKVDTLDITSQVLYNRNDMSIFNAIIVNNNDTDFNIKKLYALFTINGETKKILLTENSVVKAKDKKAINLSFDTDMLSTTKIEYVLEK